MPVPPSLLALFSAARDVDAPGFAGTIDRLTAELTHALSTTLEAEDIPIVMAHLDGLIAHLQAEKSEVGQKLAGMRSGAVLKAYQR